MSEATGAPPAETGALVTVRSALPTILAADTNDILGKVEV